MPAVSKAQQKFFGIVRAIQKGEMAPTTPETAKAAADMKKKDVKDFASTKHKGLPDKKVSKEQLNYDSVCDIDDSSDDGDGHRSHTDRSPSGIKEADMKDAPSIKDAKPQTKTDVKHYPGLGYAPTIKKKSLKEFLENI